MKLELTYRDGEESYEVRVDGRTVARIDRMLMEALQHWAKEGRETPWLEAVQVPPSWPAEGDYPAGYHGNR